MSLGQILSGPSGAIAQLIGPRIPLTAGAVLTGAGLLLMARIHCPHTGGACRRSPSSPACRRDKGRFASPGQAGRRLRAGEDEAG